jgi:hypothetical protein
MLVLREEPANVDLPRTVPVIATKQCAIYPAERGWVHSSPGALASLGITWF